MRLSASLAIGVFFAIVTTSEGLAQPIGESWCPSGTYPPNSSFTSCNGFTWGVGTGSGGGATAVAIVGTGGGLTLYDPIPAASGGESSIVVVNADPMVTSNWNITTSLTAGTGNAAGVFARFQLATGGGYLLAVDDLSASLILVAVSGGGGTVLAVSPIAGYVSGTTYDLFFSLSGSKLAARLILAGTSVAGFTVIDSTFTGGQVALFATTNTGTIPSTFAIKSAFGKISVACLGNITAYGSGCPGAGGITPTLTGSGCATPGGSVTLTLANGLGSAPALIFFGSAQASIPLGSGCTQLVTPLVGSFSVTLGGTGPGAGNGSIVVPVSAVTAPGTVVTFQGLVVDAASPIGFSVSNGVKVVVQ